MNATQLEFNINNESQENMKLFYLQKQLDALQESVGKQRRKLFSKIDELESKCMLQKIEIEELKTKFKEMTNERTEWRYKEEIGTLFNVREYKQACG